MGFEWNIAQAGACLALLVGGTAVAAPPPEPLIVTRLADPDPNFVPPVDGPRSRLAATADEDLQDPALDRAMEDFGRAIGQAALVQRQAIEARCKSNDATHASASERFAWQAACNYVRR